LCIVYSIEIIERTRLPYNGAVELVGKNNYTGATTYYGLLYESYKRVKNVWTI